MNKPFQAFVATIPMNWIDKARRVFDVDKPQHFTNYNHCCECSEHDEVLRQCDRDSIGIEELGNPGWDPITFSSVEGIKYYMPAMVRLAITTMDNEGYVEQMLFHLERDGQDNDLYRACTPAQRDFIASFIEYLIEEYPFRMESYACSDQVLRVYEIWSNGK